jgi:hypothetical protein
MQLINFMTATTAYEAEALPSFDSYGHYFALEYTVQLMDLAFV